VDAEARSRFVRSLALAPAAPAPDRSDDQAGPGTGVVNANMVTIFPDTVTGDAAQDVLDTQLLAWLSATAQFNIYKDPIEWWKRYSSVLGAVGWTVQSYDFTSFTPAEQFTLKDWVDAVMQQQDPDDAALVDHALERLLELAGTPPVATLDRYSHDDHNGVVLVLVGGKADQGPSVFCLACDFATTDDVPVQLLPYTFDAATTKCSYVSQTSSLNEQVYAPIRKAVQQKLGCNPFRYTQPFANSLRPK
jgi:hypothetical protein